MKGVVKKIKKGNQRAIRLREKQRREQWLDEEVKTFHLIKDNWGISDPMYRMGVLRVVDALLALEAVEEAKQHLFPLYHYYHERKTDRGLLKLVVRRLIRCYAMEEDGD